MIVNQPKRFQAELQCASDRALKKRWATCSETEKMVVSVALWSVAAFALTFKNSPSCRSIALKPSEASEIVPQGDLKITQVALGDELADASARNSIKITYLNREILDDDDEDEDEEDENSQAQNKKEAMTTTVLCSLTAGKVGLVVIHFSR
jgi:FK506-binding nuclear protein